MAQSNYGQYQIKIPIREVGANMKVSGVTLPSRTYMSNKLVPGCNVYVEYSWIYQMPEPELVVPSVHSHPYEQVTLMIGSDPQNPENLGAVVENYLGGERMISDRTNATFIPKGMEHGRVCWKSFDRPHLLMSITLGTGDFEKANPGGYSKK
jgi:hypothetical protein